MSQRSELMRIYLKNGITSLEEMKKHYNSFAEGGSIDNPPYKRYYATPQYGFSPESSQTNIYQPVVTDVQKDIIQGKPIGTTTAKREIRAAQQKQPEVIQTPTLSREGQDMINKAVQTANVLQPINTALDVAEYVPIIGDAISIGRAGSEAVNGNLLGAGLMAGMTLLPGVTSKPAKEILPQIKPLIRGAEIEKQLSKAGTINRKQLDSYISKQGKYYQEVMNDVLNEEFNGIDRIDYTAFQDAVQKRLPVYSRVPQTDYQDYGLDRLGYSAYEFIDGFGNSLPNSNLRTFTFETPTIVGDNRHYNGNPIGHSRTYTTKDEPDILHVMESQSDWAQHPSRIPYFGGLHSPDITVEDYKEFVDSSERTLKEMEEHSSYFLKEDIERQRADVQSFKKILENLISGNKDLQLEHLQSHYTERQIQENLKYATEHGQTKMRYPTRETAAKVEGYTTETVYTDKQGNIITNPTTYGKDIDIELDKLLKEKDEIESHRRFVDNEVVRQRTRRLRERLDEISEYDEEWGIAPREGYVDEYNRLRERIDALEHNLTETDIDRLNEIQIKLADIYSKPLKLRDGVIERKMYSPEHETILKKYDTFPKQYQKLFGKNAEVRTVTDSKGNTWYEVDVPESYRNGTGQIIFAQGGKLDIPPERFFGIATPEVTDNTVYQPTYGTLLPEVRVTPRSAIKELAHSINLYGSTLRPTKPKILDFDDFKSAQQRTYKIYSPDSSEEAPYIYKEKYGKKYPFFPNREEGARMRYIEDSLYLKDYENYKQREIDRANKVRSTPSQDAAGLSLIGSWLQLFPFTQTKILGAAMQTPDLVLDAAAAIDDPKVSTIGHNVIDYAPYIAKLIPGKYDDYILKALNLVGNTDDAMSGMGTDPLEYFDKDKTEENFSKGGKIYIKPENRGKFTALKKRTGHSASWFKENGTPAQKKMAVFALNARHFKH